MNYNDCDCPRPKRCSGCPPENIVLPPVKKPCVPMCPKNRCEEPFVCFRTQTIPASMGTSAEGQPYAPKNGMYHNMIVRYEADGSVWLYDSAGVYTNLKEAESDES